MLTLGASGVLAFSIWRERVVRLHRTHFLFSKYLKNNTTSIRFRASRLDLTRITLACLSSRINVSHRLPSSYLGDLAGLGDITVDYNRLGVDPAFNMLSEINMWDYILYQRI